MLFGVPLPAHRRQALARRARALPTCPHPPSGPPPGNGCALSAPATPIHRIPTGSVYRVLVTRPYAGPSPSCKTAPASGPRDVLGDVTQRAPRDRCGFLTLR